MSYRIVDRIVIWLGTVASVLVLCEGQPGAADIAVVLLSLILSLAGELKRDEITGTGCAAIVFVSSFFVPGLLFLIPAVVYSLANCKAKLARNASLIMRVTAAGVMVAALLLTDFTWQVRILIILLSLLACYLALKTFIYDRSEEDLRAKYDDARYESLNSRRLREEAMKNADNEVYMATLKERNRIAREIHDNVGHMITRVIVQLQAIKIINKDPGVGAQLDSVSQTLDLAMTSMRKSVHELHDDSIDLSIGINDITSTISDRFDVTVNTVIDSPADNALKNAVLGIIKEAVTNIAKHSSGDKVLIEVVENVSFWRVKVHDNGANPAREFDLSGTADNGGIGLNNIASRAGSVGGRASVISGDDGFTVMVTIPKQKRGE